MNIQPHQLNGKTIRDCYEKSFGTLIIEFTDGTKIEVRGLHTYKSRHTSEVERYIDLKLA